jgi:L-rhamnose mutarotase
VIYALHSVLKPGREADYDRVHARVPGELLSALKESGIREWRIWRSGRHLFHLVECDDFDAAIRELEHDSANERWQAVIGDYVDHFEVSASGDWRLPLLWRMTDQL